MRCAALKGQAADPGTAPEPYTSDLRIVQFRRRIVYTPPSLPLGRTRNLLRAAAQRTRSDSAPNQEWHASGPTLE